jgi:hypothetical protein
MGKGHTETVKHAIGAGKRFLSGFWHFQRVRLRTTPFTSELEACKIPYKGGQ